jgi:hypothetical protein
LEGLEKGNCFFYWTVLVLGVINMESVSRLWLVVFEVTLVLFVAELESAAVLAHVPFIARLARKSVDATSVIGRSGWGYGEGFGGT